MNASRQNKKRSLTIFTLVSILILNYSSTSFSDETVHTLITNKTVNESAEIWKHTKGDEAIFLSINKNEDNTVNVSIMNQGHYLYFWNLTQIDDTFQLTNPHWSFNDMELSIETKTNSIVLNAISEILELDIRNAVFLRTSMYPSPVEIYAELEKGSDWFVSADFMECLDRGKKIYEQAGGNAEALEILSEEDRKDYDLFFEYISTKPWETQGDGCSWYCGVMDFKTEASSTLESFSDIKYSSSNIHDYSLLTAWVEGEQGNGVGESVTISFPSGNPRVNQIHIFNGYQKSKEAYYNNGRVKVLTLFINNLEYGRLYLEDTPKAQTFRIDLTSMLNSQEQLKVRFRIDDVYEGELYKDTVISEINFSGVDVH